MSIDCYLVKTECMLPLAWAVWKSWPLRHEGRWASLHLTDCSTQESTLAPHLNRTVELVLVVWAWENWPEGTGRWSKWQALPSWERKRWQTGELVSLGELMLHLASCHRQKCWPHPLSESWPWWQGFRRAINSATTEGQIRGCELSYFNIYPKYELLELIKGQVLQPKLQNLHQHRATTGYQRGVLVKLQYWWCGVEEARNLVILISSLFLKFTK